MGNSPAVIDRLYKGACGEVEKFWRIVPNTNTESPKPEDGPVSGFAQVPPHSENIKTTGR
jgi:hypothetical protein